MKRIMKLNENDLTRIIRRVINEGAGFSTDYTSTKGSKISVFCTHADYSTITKDGKSVKIPNEVYQLLCNPNKTTQTSQTTGN
jgi:plasmid replication initiation protein